MKSLLKKTLFLACVGLFLPSAFAAEAVHAPSDEVPAVHKQKHKHHGHHHIKSKKACNCKKMRHKHHSGKKAPSKAHEGSMSGETTPEGGVQ